MLELIPHIVLLVVKGDKSAIRAAMTIYFSVILHTLEHVLAIHTTVLDRVIVHIVEMTADVPSFRNPDSFQN